MYLFESLDNAKKTHNLYSTSRLPTYFFINSNIQAKYSIYTSSGCFSQTICILCSHNRNETGAMFMTIATHIEKIKACCTKVISGCTNFWIMAFSGTPICVAKNGSCQTIQ
jgi:hypothetical protein